MKEAGWLALVLAVSSTVACSFVTVGGGVGLDAGTVGASGVEAGVGGQIEVLGYAGEGETRYGWGPSLEIAGYSTDGDGDPIVFTTMEGRFRRQAGTSSLGDAYWELGSGFGVAWTPTLQRAVLPLQAEVGVQTSLGSARLSVGARERFLFLVGSGSPPLDAFNSVQLVAGVGFEVGQGR